VVSAQAKKPTKVPKFEKVLTETVSTKLVTKTLVDNSESQVLTSTTSAIDDATSATTVAVTADAELSTLTAVAGNLNFINI
jgi:hypothetical protein